MRIAVETIARRRQAPGTNYLYCAIGLNRPLQGRDGGTAGKGVNSHMELTQDGKPADADHPIDWAISLIFLKYAIGFIFFGAALYILVALLFAPGQNLRSLLALACMAAAGAAWLCMVRGRMWTAVWILGSGVWLSLTVASFFLGGVVATPVMLYPLVIFYIGWMVGPLAAVMVALASAAATLAMALVEMQGLLPATLGLPPTLRWMVECFVFIITALIIIYFVRAYQARLTQVRELGAALTERAAALETQEADLKQAQAVAHIGSWVYEFVGDSLRPSEEAGRILGLPPGATVNHAAYFSRVQAEDRAVVDRAWESVLAGGPPFDIEHRITVGGHIAWVRQRAELQFGADGAPVRAVGTAQDITERRRHEAETQAVRNQLAATLDALPDLLFEVGLDGRIYAFHTPAPELLTAAPEKILGKMTSEVLPPSASSVAMAALREAHHAGRSHGMSYELALEAGTHWFELSVARKPGVPGGDPRFIVISRDITERKQAEAEVVRLNTSLEERVRERTAELEAANRELESFSYTVSHDLRSPLRSILGFSGLLAETLEGKLDAETRDYLARIEVSSLRMSRLIDGVLEYSRLARRTLTRSDVDLDALAGDVVAELREHYPDSDVHIGHLGRTAADPTMLRQILHNLVGNALKYSARSAKPRVEIGAEQGGSVAQYFVRDNGVGFDVKYADTLFKLFTRLHGDPAYDGTGVGLAIVKRLLERHHGRIWAEAEVGVGATFRFCLEAA